MPPQNYIALPYELDGLNSNTIPITQMACQVCAVPRDITIDSLSIVGPTAASGGNFFAAGIYDPASLGLIVGFTFPLTLAVPANACRVATLRNRFKLKAGIYVWAGGCTTGSSVGVFQPNVFRAQANLYGRSPVGIQVDSNGVPPPNLKSITQVGTVTQMLFGILLGS
jgi:hypothetical protein